MRQMLIRSRNSLTKYFNPINEKIVQSSNKPKSETWSFGYYVNPS